jgi:methylmalonyl-CoA/ethylmalonyl-CoA epimerase
MSKAFLFHHVGIAVANLDQALEFYTKALAFDLLSGPFEDRIQKVKLCFVASAKQRASELELIAPLETDSPVNGYLSKGIGAYHVCYEVSGLEETLADLRSKRCLILGNPVPAIAFDGRRIAWCFTPTRQLIELLESSSAQSL